MFAIRPLAFTTVDWSTMIAMTQNVLGDSPTRGLDSCGISTDKPAAFSACLGFDNDPLGTLRNNRHVLEHSMASFLAVLESETLLEISGLSRLRIIHQEVRRHEVLAVLTGTMREWLDAIITGSRKECTYECRRCMNACQALFVSSGFGSLWDSYSKQTLPDETIILTRR